MRKSGKTTSHISVARFTEQINSQLKRIGRWADPIRNPIWISIQPAGNLDHQQVPICQRPKDG
jgi:hypothetical protein